MFPALLLVFFLSSATADPYNCTNENIELNEGNLTFYLNTQMAGSQICLRNFTFPLNYMAEISLNFSSLTTIFDVIEIVSSWGFNSQSYIYNGGFIGTPNGSLHVMWPPSFFLVGVYTDPESSMMLTLNVALKPLLVVGKPQTLLTTAVNQQPHFVQFRDWKEDTVITAESKSSGKLVLALADNFASNAIYSSDASHDGVLFSNVFVYFTSAGDLQFLGTLFSLAVPGGDFIPFISTTETLVFYRAEDNEATATLVINDYANHENVPSYSLWWSPYKRADLNYQISFTMNASLGVTVVTLINEADGSNAIYLENIVYKRCSGCPKNPPPVMLLSGGLVRDYDTQGTLIKTYDLNDNSDYPQFLPGKARTFVLEQGAVILYYASAAADTMNSEAADERTGFVMSNNYPFMSPDQNSQDFIFNSVDGSAFIFEYTIGQQNSNLDAYLNFTLKDHAGSNSYPVDLHTVAANSTFNLTAFEMTMSIVGGMENSTGTFISYHIFGTNISDDSTEAPETTTLFADQGTTSATQLEPISSSSNTAIEVTLICLGIVLFLIVVIIATILYLRYKARRGKFRKIWVTVSGVLPITVKIDQWELGDKQLEVFEDKELGQGAFGIVFEGKLSGNRPVEKIMPSSLRLAERKNQVAVKRLLPKAEPPAKIDFLNEVNFMKKLGYHPHILGMIGCITTSDLPLIVMDYCENGDLLTWVRKHKYSAGVLHPRQLLSFAWQISDGLCYLKSINLLHRDLAARNVLLTKTLVAKISDFGLSREPEAIDDSATYKARFYVSRGGRLPIKWLAPESIRDCHFSFKTDIWSYGVLLWEIFTFGDIPFVTVQAPALLELLENGERLPNGGIPGPIYELMSSCWEAEPAKRAPIERIKDVVNEMLKAENDYRYLMTSYPSDENKEAKDDFNDVTV